MTDPGRLELNACGYRYDPTLEQAADLFDSDPQEWAKLPVVLQNHADVYRDMRASYRAAVEAGVIPDDRGPSAA